jgi:hypothetical protein
MRFMIEQRVFFLGVELLRSGVGAGYPLQSAAQKPLLVTEVHSPLQGAYSATSPQGFRNEGTGFTPARAGG